jgi:hypothetical protein
MSLSLNRSNRFHNLPQKLKKYSQQAAQVG